MKFPLHILIIFTVFLMGSCSGSPSPKNVMVGAYSDQEVSSPDQIFAVQKSLELLREKEPQWAQANLKKVLKFETQVVAGLNYRTTMILSLESGEITVMTRVYKDLQNNWSLTEYQKL